MQLNTDLYNMKVVRLKIDKAVGAALAQEVDNWTVGGPIPSMHVGNILN